jgi:histidine phosphotransferase ChpT
MISELEFSELICAKFCHDLAGPIGAISNGIEFLKEEEQTMRERAYQLVEVSANQAVTRLKFFRNIYGTSPNVGEANLSDIRQLIDSYFSGGKSTLDWPDENLSMPGISLTNRLSKLMLNVVNIANNILIYGGKVSIRLIKIPNGKRIKVTSTGANIKLDEEVLNILANNLNNVTINTKNIHIYLTQKLIEESGSKLTIERQDDSVIFLIERIKE